MCTLGFQVSELRVIDQSKARYGYRWCRVEDNGSLMPIVALTRCWQEPVASAKVNADYGDGLHIFSSMTKALSDRPVNWGYYPVCYVLCKVKYWGDVVDHKYGVLAEYASIVAINVPPWEPAHRTLIRHGNPKLDLRFRTKLGMLFAR